MLVLVLYFLLKIFSESIFVELLVNMLDLCDQKKHVVYYQNKSGMHFRIKEMYKVFPSTLFLQVDLKFFQGDVDILIPENFVLRVNLKSILKGKLNRVVVPWEQQ